MACDIGTDYLFCPTGGLKQRACVFNVLVVIYVDISSVGMQTLMLLLLAGAQDNFLQTLKQLEARAKRTPEDFKQIINSYIAILVGSATISYLEFFFQKQAIWKDLYF